MHSQREEKLRLDLDAVQVTEVTQGKCCAMLTKVLHNVGRLRARPTNELVGPGGNAVDVRALPCHPLNTGTKPAIRNPHSWWLLLVCGVACVVIPYHVPNCCVVRRYNAPCRQTCRRPASPGRQTPRSPRTAPTAGTRSTRTWKGRSGEQAGQPTSATTICTSRAHEHLCGGRYQTG